MTPPGTKRTHTHCRICRQPLWAAAAHCLSHTCPWCRNCAPTPVPKETP